MFYAQFVLAKKGPLAKIWLAAHWEKKLTKAQICETDVPQAIEEVIRPKVKMALRTVGHLLVGIVRIYAKKTRYLLADTNETYLKMKVNFRNGFSFETDLPLNANIDEDLIDIVDDCNITVPEFQDADYNEELIMANMSRLEDITIRDDANFNAVFRMNELTDEGFGDEEALWQLEQIYGTLEPGSLRPTPQQTPQPESMRVEGARAGTLNASAVSGHDGQSILVSEGSGIQADPRFDVSGAQNVNIKSEPIDHTMEVGQEDETLQADALGPLGNDRVGMFDSMINPPREQEYEEPEPMDLNQIDYNDEGNGAEAVLEPREPTPESFALEPLDLETLEGNVRKKRQRKPRKLLIDPETMISDDAFREQQEDFQDTMRVVEMAPPSRKMLKCCMNGDLAKLAITPASAIFNRELIEEYRSRLVPRAYDPNFTVQELSEHSSNHSGSVAIEPAPWEDLELNEHVEGPGPAAFLEDDFYEGVEEYLPPPQPELQQNQTLERNRAESTLQNPYPQNENNNVEEEWSDPFSASVSAQGRLEAYGFGNSTLRKPYVEDEGKWNKRAIHILKKIKPMIESDGNAKFSVITTTASNRKQAAEQFYTLLSLVKSETIRVEQTEPFGEILMMAGDRFYEALNPRETPAVDENEDPRSPKAQALESSIQTPRTPI